MYRTNSNLLEEIKAKRELMIISAHKTGLTSDETIRCSQELDKLIYEYQIQLQPERKQHSGYSFRRLIFIRAKNWFKYNGFTRSWKSI